MSRAGGHAPLEQCSCSSTLQALGFLDPMAKRELLARSIKMTGFVPPLRFVR